MLVNQKNLTIAIPTYNRANYLDRLLESIFKQNKIFLEVVEVLVSNNASTDNTFEVVNKYISLGMNIKYFENQENKGADKNIASCFMKSIGEYVWIVGDDDVLVNDALSIVIPFLTNNPEVDILHLGFKSINEATLDFKLTSSELTEVVLENTLENKVEFIRKTHFWLCYISIIIVNKKSLKSFTIAEKFFNTNLVQLSWVFESINNARKLALIETEVILHQPDNTEGWGFFETVRNFLLIVKEQFSQLEIYRVFENSILFYWVSGYLIRYKRNDLGKMLNESKFEIIFEQTFKGNLYYRLLFKKYLPSKNLVNKIYETSWLVWRIINKLTKYKLSNY